MDALLPEPASGAQFDALHPSEAVTYVSDTSQLDPHMMFAATGFRPSVALLDPPTMEIVVLGGLAGTLDNARYLAIQHLFTPRNPTGRR